MYPKYAMALDPKVKDFKSQGLASIPELLAILSEIEDIPSFKKLDKLIRLKLHKLWFYINLGKGINLKDREKLIPIFKEFSRIFAEFEKRPNVAYRGLVLPPIYKTLLTDTSGKISPKNKVIPIIESLAYGLRSWSRYYESAEGWANPTESKLDVNNHDSIIFVYKNPNIIFDCDAYYSKIFLRISDKRPFDGGELICFAEHPKVFKIEKLSEKNSQASNWKVYIR